MWKYETRTNTWTTIPYTSPSPPPRANASLWVNNNHSHLWIYSGCTGEDYTIYYEGNHLTNLPFNGALWQLDLSSGEWTIIGNKEVTGTLLAVYGAGT